MKNESKTKLNWGLFPNPSGLRSGFHQPRKLRWKLQSMAMASLTLLGASKFAVKFARSGIEKNNN